MKKLNLVTTTLLLSSLTLGACGNNSATPAAAVVSPLVVKSPQEKLDSNKNYDAWKKLITSNEKNVALAEVLSASVAAENQDLINQLTSSLSNEEIQTIITQAQSEQDALRKNLLFRGNIQLEGSDLFRKSIVQEDYTFNKTSPDSAQMMMATFGYLKSKSLDEIYKSFDHVIDENSKDVAKAMMLDIAKNAALSAELENAAKNSSTSVVFAENLRKSTEFLKLIDEKLEYSGLNQKEQFATLATGIIGVVIYTELKGSKTFVNIQKKYQDVKAVVLNVKEKIALLKLSVQVIKTDRDLIIASTTDLKEGLEGVKDGIASAYSSLVAGAESDEKIDKKKTAKFLYDKVIKGNDLNKETSNPSILASQKMINENLTKSFKASGTMADSLTNIINMTNILSEKIGIKIPAGIQHALQTASTVAAGVKIASAVAQGFMSGGVLTAVNALNSGALSGLMGGGGPDPVMMATLGRIEAKLDVVLVNQQRMLDLQMETIKMIKNLAIMIDEYHQKEMIALASLHDDVMVNREINQALFNQKLSGCTSLIDFQLNKDFTYRNFGEGSAVKLTATELDFNKFYSYFKTAEDFKIFTKGANQNDYSDCQSAISSAFGAVTNESNPIFNIYNSNGDQNLYAFDRDIYQPMLSYLNSKVLITNKKALLRMPMAFVTDLNDKSAELLSKKSIFKSGGVDGNLSKMLSTRGIEKYLAPYLILYPILEFDKNEWNLSLPKLVDNYYKNMIVSDGLSLDITHTSDISRGYYFMNNALELVQTAIAQESILAGESIIPLIYKSMDLLNVDSDSSSYVANFRENKLLMRNYLVYLVQANRSYAFNLAKYKSAYEKQDLATLSFYFGLQGKSKDSLSLSDEKELILTVKGINKNIIVKLPSAEEVEDNEMLYSENMPRLLKMQKNIVNALTKLSPSPFRTVDNRNGLANLLLLKKF